MMEEQQEEPKQPQDKFLEKVELLRACLGMEIFQATSYAAEDDEKFIEIINSVTERMLGVGMKRVATFPENFYGKYFTIRQGRITAGSAWDMIQIDVLECLRSEGGEQVRQLLQYLLDQPDFTADFTAFKAKFARFRKALDTLTGYSLVKKEVFKEATRYSLYRELVPLIRGILSSKEVAELAVVSSEAAGKELAEVAKMEENFAQALGRVIESIDETLEFGRTFSIAEIVKYFRGMFGPTLYFDAVLALAQQYGMTDTEVVNPEGGPALKTGFHLALFGSPGTGKTFAVRDLMMGVPERGVKAHGIPGINRYCGGVTPALFIRIGEAYQNKRFNFVVTEFNDWFKYKGMVEPLKIALEQGFIRYETKAESIGPYKFSSFFTTNYNTRTEGAAGYQVTVSDPNFNAIEDRMLVRLHRMTIILPKIWTEV